MEDTLPVLEDSAGLARKARGMLLEVRDSPTGPQKKCQTGQPLSELTSPLTCPGCVHNQQMPELVPVERSQSISQSHLPPRHNLHCNYSASDSLHEGTEVSQTTLWEDPPEPPRPGRPRPSPRGPRAARATCTCSCSTDVPTETSAPSPVTGDPEPAGPRVPHQDHLPVVPEKARTKEQEQRVAQKWGKP